MMSQKLSAKNLHYDSSLPPFLARLRGQQEAERTHGGPDPILAAHRRPGQKRSTSEEAEDAPLIVDEEGNVVDYPTASRDRGDDKNNPSSKGGEQEGDRGGKDTGREKESQGDDEREKEKVATIGASRKRKVGRVVAVASEKQSESESESEKDDDAKKNHNTNSWKRRPRQQHGDTEARIAKASAEIRYLVDGDNDTATPIKTREKKVPEGKTTIQTAKKKTSKKIKLSFNDGDEGE
ncbi:hypothetical protein F5Y17DRAFT_46986 [Xylariaceae sp. FL0594]|nr:hypothetical protein F5Y17DRAFT_46986 [Xylariaceae sp. FL0594]